MLVKIYSLTTSQRQTQSGEYIWYYSVTTTVVISSGIATSMLRKIFSMFLYLLQNKKIRGIQHSSDQKSKHKASSNSCIIDITLIHRYSVSPVQCQIPKKENEEIRKKKFKEKNTTKQRVLFYQILSIRKIKEKGPTL